MFNRLFIILAAVAGLCFAGWSAIPPQSREGSILLGTAVRTFTPTLGVPLVGYPRPRPNTGVALDLCARAAVFGTPGKSEPQAALVVLDLIHVDAELGHAIRERAAAAMPGLAPAAIMVSATHTHSGPAVSGRYAGDTDLPYVMALAVIDWLISVARPDPHDDVIRRVISFHQWCRSQPRVTCAADDISTIEFCGFFEHLFDDEALLPLVPHLLPKEELELDRDL